MSWWSLQQNTHLLCQLSSYSAVAWQVLLAFTLIRKEGVRNEFWGQAIVDGASVLDTKRNKLRINLGDLKVRPHINQCYGISAAW